MPVFHGFLELMGVVSSGLLMISGACLVLGFIHLRFWIAERKRQDYLAFAIVCLSVAVFAWFELALCHSQTAEEYNFYTRWSHIAAAPAIISAGWFAYLNLGGRRWLFLLVCGARLAGLFLNFLLTPNINFRELTAVGQTPVFGEVVAYPIGTANPWMLVSQGAQLLLIIFCLDASIQVWRRGNHRKALIFGTGVALFALTSLTFSIGVLWGLVSMPILASVSIFFIIAAMVYELNHRLQSSAMLSDRLIHSEMGLRESLQQLNMSATAAQVGLWTKKLGEESVWASAKMRELFGVSNKKDLTFDDFLQKIHPTDMGRFQDALGSAETRIGGFQVEYRVFHTDSEIRWLDSRGRVEVIDENTKVVRGAVVDITKRINAETAVHELSRRLINAQEKERARLARELHDDLSQSMALLSIQLAELRDKNNDPAFVRSQIDKLVSEIERLSADVHRISHELHPAKLHQLGLELALRGFCRELAALHSARIDFHADALPRSLPDDVALCLYRVAQESLQNVVKHSHASVATVNISGEGELVHLVIADNGSGFNEQEVESKESLGLISISERIRAVSGSVSVITKIGVGTKIDVRVPLKHNQVDSNPNHLAFITRTAGREA